MANQQAGSADLRAAVRWLRDNHPWNLGKLEEAARRFNLSPLDEEFLLQRFRDQDGDPEPKQ